LGKIGYIQRIDYEINSLKQCNPRESIMPYKVGKKTKTKGWPILQKEKSKWKVIAHSNTREKAQASIRARHMGSHNKG
jgi:hypothetical protein